MRKSIAILIVISSILLSGCTTKNTQVDGEKKKDGGLIESIRGAMAKSVSLKCEYPATNQDKVVAYIRGESVRIDSLLPPNRESVGTIIKGDTMWTWNNVKKEGTMITMPKEEREKENGTKKLIDDLEANKQFCQIAVVVDSVFEPPSDIKFTDLTKMFEKIAQ